LGELNQSGVILSTDGSVAKVQMKRMGACSGDHAGCPWNAFIESVPQEDFVIEAKNLIGAGPGDMVEVAIRSKTLFKAVFMAYVVPLMGLTVGYFTGWATANLLGLSHFAGISGGIFMAVGFMGSFLAIRKRAKTYNAGYELVRIYGANRLNSYLDDRRICATACKRLNRCPEK